MKILKKFSGFQYYVYRRNCDLNNKLYNTKHLRKSYINCLTTLVDGSKIETVKTEIAKSKRADSESPNSLKLVAASSQYKKR